MTSKALLALAIVMGSVACGSPPAPTPTPAPAPAPTGTPAPGPEPTASPGLDRAADLALLEKLFRDRHPAAPDVTAALDLGGDEPDDVDAARFLVTVMAATAGRERDGHSGTFPTAQPRLTLWPLQLYDFDDGWRVVDAADPSLVGREVTGVGGTTVEDAVRRVSPLVPHDNLASLRGRLPQYLVVPQVLEGVGLRPTLELDGDTVTPTPVPAQEYAERFGIFYPLVCPPLPGSAEPLWSVDTDGDAVTLRVARMVFRSEGRSTEELAAELETAVAEADAHRVVVDLRDNPGGELPAARPLVAALEDIAAARPGSLRILVNRCTFSAAALTVAELLETADATLVGEPMGGATGIWADARPFTLPRSGIVVHVATRWYEAGAPDTLVLVEPDVRVPVTWLDRSAGRDPALDVAIRG